MGLDLGGDTFHVQVLDSKIPLPDIHQPLVLDALQIVNNIELRVLDELLEYRQRDKVKLLEVQDLILALLFILFLVLFVLVGLLLTFQGLLLLLALELHFFGQEVPEGVPELAVVIVLVTLFAELHQVVGQIGKKFMLLREDLQALNQVRF